MNTIKVHQQKNNFDSLLNVLIEEIATRVASSVTEKIEEKREIKIKGDVLIPISEVYISRNEAAKALNVSLPTISKYMQLGKVPYKRIGRKVLIKKEDLYNF
jgi:excisionase family DNA binding protein